MQPVFEGKGKGIEPGSSPWARDFNARYDSLLPRLRPFFQNEVDARARARDLAIRHAERLAKERC